MVLPAIASGIVENHFFNRRVDTARNAIENVIRKAEETGLGLINAGSSQMTLQQIQALNNVTTLLQNLQVVYRSEMDHTVDKVHDMVRQSLAQADTVVYEIIQKTFNPTVQQHLQSINAMAQSLLQLNNGKAVLTSISPSFISPSQK